MVNQMTFGSLFSGIGGIDLGLERAGMTCKWQVEIDDFCQKVLTKHWPDVPKYKDVKEVGRDNLETVDLIAGGFPCQPASVAGKRKGTEDDRWLWPEMLRVIQELKPSWVFAENVTGLLSLHDGMVFEQVLSSLEAEGYETMPPFIIPACAVDAPHRWDRVWIMAYSLSNERRDEIRRGPQEKSRVQKINRPEYGERGGACRTSEIRGSDKRHGAIPNSNKQHGNGGGFHSSEVSQFQEAELSGRKNVPNDDGKRFQKQWKQKSTKTKDKKLECCSKWLPEPSVGRVAHGVPSRVDRLKSLGNAVVPQVAEYIGKAIMHSNQALHRIADKAGSL